MNILVVRLGALGDIVHTIPAAAALRAAHPHARIDWLVDTSQRQIIDLIQGIDRVIAVPSGTPAGWLETVRELRRVSYDAALDFQGLMKSAVLARASGARRVVGFSIWHLREKAARPFYSETAGSDAVAPPRGEQSPDIAVRQDSRRHVIHKNLSLLRTLGVHSDRIVFPLARGNSEALRDVRRALGSQPFALINPGAAWPNKRWPAGRFAEVALFLRDVRGLPSIVLWGPGEEPLARAVVEFARGAAHVAPPSGIADLLELARAASLVVSGDTGPLHIALAVGTPAVALYGPTDPVRNGPWSSDDLVVSRHASCRCHYARRCHQKQWCLGEITPVEVTAAIQRRLTAAAAQSPSSRDRDAC